jgi:hypothetical protein
LRGAFLLLYVSALLETIPTAAFPTGRSDGSTITPCFRRPHVKADGRLTYRGELFVGNIIELDATTVKVFYYENNCEAIATFPFACQNSWQLTKPPGSAATLTETGDRTASLVPDVLGVYAVTYALGPCSVGGGQQISATEFSTTINVQTTQVRPPEAEPMLPPSANAFTGYGVSPARSKCCGEYGFFRLLDGTPEWVTVASSIADPFAVPEDYQTLEGYVWSSRPRGDDNPLNHDDSPLWWGDYHDLAFAVVPDPAKQYLITTEGGPSNTHEIEVEWQFNKIPEIYWPTPGDRVSVIGYWIHDCGRVKPIAS